MTGSRNKKGGSSRGQFSRAKILIVEDDPVNLKILGDYLAFKGFSITLAKDGPEGLEKFLSDPPHLVLLDALLPNMDGFEVLRRIRGIPSGKNVPILIMSAVYKAPRVQIQAQKVWGADGYMVKPFELSEMEKKIHSLLSVRRHAPAESMGPAVAGGEGTRPSTGGIEFSGQLTNLSLPQLLAVIWQFKETGALILKRGKQTKEIAFVEGHPVHASSSLPSDDLGSFLVKLEKVTDADMKEYQRMCEESGRSLKSVLMSLNVMSEEDLAAFGAYNLKETILSSFAWPDGTYRFRHDDAITQALPPAPRTASPKSLKTVNIVHEGIKRYYSREKLEALFYALKDKPLSIGKKFSSTVIDLDLSPSERKVLSLINGERKVEDIMYISGLDVTKTFVVLYTLLVLNIIKPFHI